MTFTDFLLNKQISEAYSKMYSDSLKSIDESLTIPPNTSDGLEIELYNLIKKSNGFYGDNIVRWFRNDRKSGVDENILRTNYITNFTNIIDLMKSFDKYLSILKRDGGKTTIPLQRADGKEWKFNPITDFPKIRSLDGAKSVVKAVGDIVYTADNDDEQAKIPSKYAINPSDKTNIVYVGRTAHVTLWATKTFESTNKFVFNLWQAADTMDRGDVYGDKSVQSPYCTHSIDHWNYYADGNSNYEQFWFLKIPNTATEFPAGITNLNDKSAMKLFSAYRGKGAETILAMDDTGGDFLDDNDEGLEFDGITRKVATEFGDEVVSLHRKFIIDKSENIEVSYLINDNGIFENTISSKNQSININGEKPQPKSSVLVAELRLNISGETIPENIKNYTSLRRIEIVNCYNLKNLVGLPKKVADNSLVSVVNSNSLESLEGIPENVSHVHVYECENLKSVKGLPTESIDTVQLINLYSLTSLNGIPKNILSLDIENCNITSLDCSYVNSINNFVLFDCHDITSLQDGPQHVTTYSLKSLASVTNVSGIPSDCKKVDIRYLPITTLEGLPDDFRGIIRLDSLNIKDLTGIPSSVKRIELGDLPHLESLKNQNDYYMYYDENIEIVQNKNSKNTHIEWLIGGRAYELSKQNSLLRTMTDMLYKYDL